MKQNLILSVAKSLYYSGKDSVYQIIIVALLSAIITGSLFTGNSVRSSLRKTTAEKLGNADIIVSSGLRFFDESLAGRIQNMTGEKAVSILESDGYCQNFSNGATVLHTKIYGVGNDFFSFNNNDTLSLKPGYAAVNSKLASRLGINQGDEIIIHLRPTDPIPSNAPFSPSKNSTENKVIKVGRILTSSESGNFSLGVSQIMPLNIFMNIKDLEESDNSISRRNRMLIQNKSNKPISEFLVVISKQLELSDIGLSLRKSEKTGETELISDRIFIDSAVVSEVEKQIPSASPVITYLANSLTVNGKSAPYSFVAAIPLSMMPGLSDDVAAINRWLADDLGARKDDTLTLTWFDAGYNSLLKEKTRQFVIGTIIENNSKWSDPSLMPDFPGISGRTSCSGWDAGIPIMMNRIREKDEAYWKEFRGTPKAFISYNTGKEIWGNNFGTATTLRFPITIQAGEITERLKGSLDPAKSGLTVSDSRLSSEKAAAEGVDFSTLFLGLGLFIIVSCILLLIMAEAIFFETRRNQVKTFYYLGFRNSLIKKHLFLESSCLSLAGALPGALLGYLVNILIIKALNSVWSGAVQTNTLSPEFSFTPLLSGFLITAIITSILILILSGRFLKVLSTAETGALHVHSTRKNLLFLIIVFIAAAVTLILSLLQTEHAVILAFSGGTFLFISLVLLRRYIYIIRVNKAQNLNRQKDYSLTKYSFFHPGHAVTPVIFIAAGIFAVIITGANKQVISKKDLTASGGTGGYLLWAESALPVKENLTSEKGRNEFDLNEPEFRDIVLEQYGRVSGDDASCLNLNHVTSPPVLGINPLSFIRKGSFSFSSLIKNRKSDNPWALLEVAPGNSTIYGIADQTVLEWGLKIKTGDTLKIKAENGQTLNIIICAGLKSSLFQGYLLIGDKNFSHYFPSADVGSVFLIDGKAELSNFYRTTLNERLSAYGFSSEPAEEKLASFFQVTNTYLEVFTVLGIFGMVLGTAGLGFVMMANYNRRKREFALMIATGYTKKKIRRMLLADQALILIWGVSTGSISAVAATYPSIKSDSNSQFNILIIIVISIIVTGFISLLISISRIAASSLSEELRRE